MDLERLEQAWHSLGLNDPRWAILSEAGRKGGGGDDASFWQSGVSFVRWLAQYLEAVGQLPMRGRALDFGCGHGRLTQAIAQHFAGVVGVDIAESMLAAARLANRHGERVDYVHNPRTDLAVFGDATFDFVLTVLVLQHMRPEYALGYIGEFLRVLRPGGVAFFQIPILPLVPAPRPSATITDRLQTLGPIDVCAATAIAPSRFGAVSSGHNWLRVDVRNLGRVAWHAGGGIEIGARFQRVDEVPLSEPVWVRLPHDVAPGEDAGLLVPVRVPPVTGDLVLQVLPAVGRAWVAHPGNPGACVNVRVMPATQDRPAPNVPPPQPRFPDASRRHESSIEVHGTPLQDVAAVVAAGGGDMVQLGLDAWAGHEWISAHITVRKRPLPSDRTDA